MRISDWSSDVCSSDLHRSEISSRPYGGGSRRHHYQLRCLLQRLLPGRLSLSTTGECGRDRLEILFVEHTRLLCENQLSAPFSALGQPTLHVLSMATIFVQNLDPDGASSNQLLLRVHTADRKSTRLNSSH